MKRQMIYRIGMLILLATSIGCDDIQQPTAQQPASPETSQGVTAFAETTIETSPPDDKPDATPEAPAAGIEIVCKVVGIVDGDTIEVLTAEKKTIRVRLNGIDAPETGQPFGKTAKEFLSEKIGGHIVRVVSHGKDRYGRTIGEVFTTESGPLRINPDDSIDRENESNPQSSVNCSMVVNGLAWHYVQYAPDRKDLADAEAWAKAKQLRLWSDPRYVAPWEWRKLSKAERDKLR